MAEPDLFDRYVAELARALRIKPADRPRILDEVRDHLAEATLRGCQAGLTTRDAQRRAIERFGPPQVVAEQFARQAGASTAAPARRNAWRRAVTKLRCWRTPMKKETRERTCSFCGRTNEEVRRLIAGPQDVHICDKCVALCNEILAKEGVTA